MLDQLDNEKEVKPAHEDVYTAVARVPVWFFHGTVRVMVSSVPSGQPNRSPVATPVDFVANTPNGSARSER